MKVLAKCTGCCKHLLSLHLLSPLHLFFFFLFACFLFTQPLFTTLGPLSHPSTSDTTHKGRKKDMHTPKEPPRRSPRRNSQKHGVQVWTSCAHTTLSSQQKQEPLSPGPVHGHKPARAQTGPGQAPGPGPAHGHQRPKPLLHPLAHAPLHCGCWTHLRGWCTSVPFQPECIRRRG